MKKLFAIVVLVLCIVAFSDFDASARPRGPRGPKARIGRCMKCGGSGRVRCSNCGGKGFTSKRELADEGWWTQYYGCRRCGGYGHRTSEGYIGENLHKGSGKMRCPSCHGRGR